MKTKGVKLFHCYADFKNVDDDVITEISALAVTIEDAICDISKKRNVSEGTISFLIAQVLLQKCQESRESGESDEILRS